MNSGVALVTAIAEHLDFENVNAFRREMDHVLSEATEVVLDMRQLRFVDSSGLGAILSSLRRLSSSGGDLRLACVTPEVAALLQLVRLDQIIGIYESSEEAVRSFR
jgi:anti-sigma B factor antagonist